MRSFEQDLIKWSGTPTVKLHVTYRDGTEFVHNFYNCTHSPAAFEAHQYYEYEHGCVSWIEYMKRGV